MGNAARIHHSDQYLLTEQGAEFCAIDREQYHGRSLFGGCYMGRQKKRADHGDSSGDRRK